MKELHCHCYLSAYFSWTSKIEVKLASVLQVKEQSLCTLWNLSVDEKLREKIANSDLLLLLIKFLEDEDVKVKEAAGGVLANLALSHSNHKTMVEAGVIPKLVRLTLY